MFISKENASSNGVFPYTLNYCSFLMIIGGQLSNWMIERWCCLGQAYHRAKQTFHTAKPDRLVGREKEVEEISKFVRGCVSQKTSGSLYISGAPGTGKTASLSHILDNIKVQP